MRGALERLKTKVAGRSVAPSDLAPNAERPRQQADGRPRKTLNHRQIGGFFLVAAGLVGAAVGLGGMQAGVSAPAAPAAKKSDGVSAAQADLPALEKAGRSTAPRLAASKQQNASVLHGAQEAARGSLHATGRRAALDAYAQKRLDLLEKALMAQTAVAIAPAGGSNGGMSRAAMLAQIDKAQASASQSASSGGAVADVYARDMARIKRLAASGSPLLVARPAPGAGNGPPLPGGQMNGAGGGNAVAAPSAPKDKWSLGNAVKVRTSPYELRAGFVIPAVLIGGINSELPGQVVGQVAQDVYDTATGKYLLIPQGSRLIGTYSANVAYGQSRVLVSWQRIVFPDGRTLDIGGMPGADAAGNGGFKDQVNNHYLRIFGSALLMSGITAGIAYSQNATTSSTNNGTTNVTLGGAMAQALGQQLGQVAGQMIQKNMSVAPTLQIRPGYEFNVVVTKDMTFAKPYRAFDY